MVKIKRFLKNKTSEKKADLAQSVRHGHTCGYALLMSHSSCLMFPPRETPC